MGRGRGTVSASVSKSGHVAPDAPVITIDPTAIDSYDLDDETKEALLVFWNEQQLAEEARAREAELAYQTEQAEAILSRPEWTEIRADWLDAARNARDRKEWDVDGSARTYVYDPDGREYSLLDLPEGIPTIHQFYRDLYGSEVSGLMPEPHPILVNHRDRMHPYQVYEDYPSFIGAVQEETSFIYLGRFWEPTRDDGLKFSVSKKNAMTHINGVCIDIDRVKDAKGQSFQAKWVVDTLMEFLSTVPALMPNYLMLSGTGIQLWYVFGESIPLLSKKAPRRAKYDEFIKRLYGYFDERLPRNRFKVDRACAAYNHAFRAPGSPSKGGYPARLFVRNGIKRAMADPIAMSDFIDGGLRPYDVGEWVDVLASFSEQEKEVRNRAATEKQLAYINKLHSMGCIDDETFAKAVDMTVIEADEAIKRGESSFVRGVHYRETGGGFVTTSNGHKIRLRPRSRRLYDNVLRRIHEETKPGSRYMAMFVLAGFAYNCNVSKPALEHDMRGLMGSEWGRKPSPSDRKPIGLGDIRSALKGYNPIGCLRPKEIAEELLGWNFGPSVKRNGRARREHLWDEYWFEEREDGTKRRTYNKARVGREKALELRREDVSDEKTRLLAELLHEKPWASKRAAAKELHMSASTVGKYWAAACDAAGIADARTGNHSPK